MDDDRTETTETDAPGPTPDDIKTAPPSNPPVDDDAVEQGEDQLGRVKPY